jgi:hypothetical protein
MQTALEEQVSALKEALEKRDETIARFAKDLEKTREVVAQLRKKAEEQSAIEPVRSPVPPVAANTAEVLAQPSPHPPTSDVKFEESPDPAPFSILPAYRGESRRPGLWTRLKRYLNGTVVELPAKGPKR